MSWYAAHIIMIFRYKHPPQKRFPAWENVVLFEATSTDEAFGKAEEYGRLEEGDDDGSLRWGGRPATRVFAGVRKLTECRPSDKRPSDGTEVTYTELELDSQDAVDQLVTGGDDVFVRYRERFRPPVERLNESVKPLKRSGRKRV